MPEVSAIREAFVAVCARVAAIRPVDAVALTQSAETRARELWRAMPRYAEARDVGVSSWEALWGRFSGDGALTAFLDNWTPSFRLVAWAAALADHGVEDEAMARDLAASFESEVRRRFVLFPESLDVLRQARERYRLGLLTNGAASVQQEKIDATCIEGYFEAVVITGDLGVGKPRPEPFLETLRRLDAAPEQSVMIGNSLERDIAGARNVGMRTIWIHRDETRSDGAYCDVALPDLRGLSAALESLTA